MPKSRKNRNNRKHRGGGGGSGWAPGGPLVNFPLNAQVNQRYDACLSAARPGQLSFSPAGGLPGMSGGAYTNNLMPEGGIAGFAQIDRDTSHCMPNHTNQPFQGGLLQKGGVGLVAASGSPILEEHTARYSTAPSQWTNSVGAPILLNQPLNGAAWSKACTQTGGKKRGSKGKKSRKTRKNKSKKSKSKKHSRRH